MWLPRWPVKVIQLPPGFLGSSAPLRLNRHPERKPEAHREAVCGRSTWPAGSTNPWRCKWGHVQDDSSPSCPVTATPRDPKWKLPLPALEPWKWKWQWSRPVVSDSLWPRGPTRLLHPWDSPGNSTGTMRSSDIRSQWPRDRCDQWSDDHYDLKPLSFKVTCQSQWRRRRASEEFLLSCHVVTAELPFFYVIIYPLIKPLLAPIIQLLCVSHWRCRKEDKRSSAKQTNQKIPILAGDRKMAKSQQYLNKRRDERCEFKGFSPALCSLNA